MSAHQDHYAHQQDGSKATPGFWIYLKSDCRPFASLFATFAVLAGNVAGGRAEAELFDLPYVGGEALLLASSATHAGDGARGPSRLAQMAVGRGLYRNGAV